MSWNLLAAQEDMKALLVIVFALIIITLIVLLFALLAKFFWLWIQSVTTGAKVGLMDLAGMWLRRVDLKTIVRSKIMAVQAGLGEDEITSQLLEAHYLAVAMYLKSSAR